MNNTHLINFDATIVQENSAGDLEFVDDGIFQGRCSLLCHGKDHEDTGCSIVFCLYPSTIAVG